MSRRREYHLESRFVVTADNAAKIRDECSPSSRTVWISKDCRLNVYTLRGVPGKFIDLLFPDSVVDPLACEIGLKIGSFDSKKRWRLAFRPWKNVCRDGSCPCVQFPGSGRVLIEHQRDGTGVIALWYKQGMWAQCFPVLDWTVDHNDLQRILMGQWKSYFSFLPYDDARQLADYWAILPHTVAQTDIVVLNRSASSALYDLARQLGWRKLTLREKLKLGLSPDSPTWQRLSTLRWYGATGTGQFTVEAASGSKAMGQSDRDGFIMTSHGPVEID